MKLITLTQIETKYIRGQVEIVESSILVNPYMIRMITPYKINEDAGIETFKLEGYMISLGDECNVIVKETPEQIVNLLLDAPYLLK